MFTPSSLSNVEFHTLAFNHGVMEACGGMCADFYNGEITLAWVPDYLHSEFGTLGVAVRGLREPINRPEVGMYWAISRAINREGLRLPNVVTPNEMHGWLSLLADNFV